MSSARAGKRTRAVIAAACAALVGGGWAARELLSEPAPAAEPAPARDVAKRTDTARKGVLARQRRMRARQPVAPPPDRGIAAYQAAVEGGSERPGELAFRANADAFFDHNLDIARERAARDGVSLEELREMTYLGLLAMRLRQWGAVEAALGHELAAETRQTADDLVFAASDELKRDIAALVAAGAPPSERRAAIRAAEERFLAEYLAITGLSPAQYDALLGAPFAGDG